MAAQAAAIHSRGKARSQGMGPNSPEWFRSRPSGSPRGQTCRSNSPVTTNQNVAVDDGLRLARDWRGDVTVGAHVRW